MRKGGSFLRIPDIWYTPRHFASSLKPVADLKLLPAARASGCRGIASLTLVSQTVTGPQVQNVEIVHKDLSRA